MEMMHTPWRLIGLKKKKKNKRMSLLMENTKKRREALTPPFFSVQGEHSPKDSDAFLEKIKTIIPSGVLITRK